MALYELLGGREWLRAAGLKLDAPPQKAELRLALPPGPQGNRVTVAVEVLKGRPVYTVTWWQVSADGEDADRGREIVGDLLPAEIAAVIARSAADNRAAAPAAA